MNITNILNQIHSLTSQEQQQLLSILSRKVRTNWENNGQNCHENSYDLTQKDEEEKGEVLTLTVRTLDEFCHVVDNITWHWRQCSTSGSPQAEFFPGELSPWFRGNTDSEYECDPSLLRQVNRRYILFPPGTKVETGEVSDEQIKINIRNLESYLLQRFKTFAVPLVQREIEKEIQWLFLMQHHLLYTRLLDWSKSSLIALFFAIRKFEEKGKSGCPNAAIWMLEPRKLSESIHKTRSIYGANITEHEGLIDFYLHLKTKDDKDTISHTNRDKKDISINLDEANPLPLIPDLVSPRIASQLGRFTFHTHKTRGLVRFAKKLKDDERRWYLVKIIIPHECHASIMRSLRVASDISHMTTSQDLDGVAEELKWRIRLGMNDIKYCFNPSIH